MLSENRSSCRNRNRKLLMNQEISSGNCRYKEIRLGPLALDECLGLAVQGYKILKIFRFYKFRRDVMNRPDEVGLRDRNGIDGNRRRREEVIRTRRFKVFDMSWLDELESTLLHFFYFVTDAAAK
jgi:hypothetical protein